MPGGDFRGPGGSWAGGPSQHQKSSAASLQETDALISAYEHLTSVPDPSDALIRLRKIASLVKPIMRKRGWRVRTLAEFLPDNPQLLGLNINRGQKICVRLRYTHNPASMLPIEQCVDTMLHELSHIVHGPHDAKFHALWDELRDEHETLLMRGYTGEGFLTKGHRLGGAMPPPQELRRLARQSAENRRQNADIARPGGIRLGGKRILPGQNPRTIIADAIERRNTINRGCASGSCEAESLSRQNASATMTVRSEEDDANDRAIAEALLELMEEEELQKLNEAGGMPEPGLAWDPKRGLYSIGEASSALPPASKDLSEEEQLKWAIEESMKALPSSADLATKPLPQIPIASTSISHNEPDLPRRGVQSTANEDAMPPAKRSRIGTPSNEPITIEDTPQPARPASTLPDVHSSAANAQHPSFGRDPPKSPTPTALAQALSAATAPFSAPNPLTTTSPMSKEWPCDICTLLNPPLHLVCGACGMERPPQASLLSRSNAAENLARVERQAAVTTALRDRERVKTADSSLDLGWACERCGTFVEHKYWTCTLCGLMKRRS